MKDNFSKQAMQYAKFRPTYPREMIEYVMDFSPRYEHALDIATGNGQLAAELAKKFEHVYATDMSDEQLQHAVKAKNIIYRKESAERTSFDAGQFDLITVAQAAHWFDFKKFNPEIYRILKPDGVLAILGYGLFSTNPDSDRIIRNFYKNTIGAYWDPERRYLDEDYTTLPFPYDELPAREFFGEWQWSFEQLTGYLETWSAVQHYKDKNGSNPVDIIRDELKASWKDNDQKVTFPFLMRLGTLKR